MNKRALNKVVENASLKVSIQRIEDEESFELPASEKPKVSAVAGLEACNNKSSGDLNTDNSMIY